MGHQIGHLISSKGLFGTNCSFGWQSFGRVVIFKTFGINLQQPGLEIKLTRNN